VLKGVDERTFDLLGEPSGQRAYSGPHRAPVRTSGTLVTQTTQLGYSMSLAHMHAAQSGRRISLNLCYPCEFARSKGTWMDHDGILEDEQMSTK